MVSVIVRLRPLRQHEEGEVVRYQLPKGISVCTHPEKQQFEAFDDFDRVFTEQATQQDIFQVSPSRSIAVFLQLVFGPTTR
jgi:hypothetical protein